MKNILFFILGIPIIIIFVSFTGTLGEEVGRILFDNSKDLNEVMTQTVKDINDRTPILMENIRFDSVSWLSEKESIIYKYTLINDTVDKFDEDYFKNTISQKVRNNNCSLEQMEAFRKLGITTQYDYFDKNGNLITSFSIDLSKCG